MTDEVRLYLEGAKESALRCADLRERVSKLDATARKVTSQLSAAPGGGGAGKDSVLLSLADAREQLNAEIAEEVRRQRSIGAFIDGLDCSAAARAVMRRRYLHYESWVQVLLWLDRKGLPYAERSVYRLHGEAMAAARDAWEKRRADV